MNAQQINFKALANTARECAQLANGVSGTIKWIVAHWNLCCQQSDLINFTTEARYTRRAMLAADMLRMADQLDNLAEGKDALAVEQRSEWDEMDSFSQWNAIDTAHEEALEMNARHDEKAKDGHARWCAFIGGNDYPTRRAIIEADHAEALEMNEEIDLVRSVEAMTAEEAVIDAGRVTDTETAHVEALGMNAAFDSSFHRRAANWGAMDAMSRWIELEKAHSEALEMDEVIELAIRKFKYGVDHYQAVVNVRNETHNMITTKGYELGWTARMMVKMILTSWRLGEAAAKAHREHLAAMLAAAPANGSIPGYEIPF